MHKIITPVEAKKIIDVEKNIKIIDVREEDELIEGYIENSVLIPLDTIRDNAEKILKNKNDKILVYCRSGRRSAIACEVLDELGYTDVYDFGGIIDWPFEKVM
ncbi:MAG: rhodanese-like domain-containing protein [Clostridia bacterium]|nr:rhodanese-like domain-containing protein [Clostridia bacterium]